MTEIVNTLNSVYEIDHDASRVRRLEGVNDPTPNQGKDGEWRQFTHLLEGPYLTFVWNITQCTRTSMVTARSTQ